ncbi:MAG: zinc metallopeptidase [Leptolyngbyaceae cyanobacterium MAG.088]|nr:zinc metallopeptidase [Leptolyngbyaceae cyanobacterium MAG.088]
MKKTGRRSSNIDDRRGATSSLVVGGGGLGTLVLAVIVMLLGGNPNIVLEPVVTNPSPSQPRQTSPNEDALADFTSVVLADTEDIWNQIFQEQIGQDYPEPTLVLYSGSTQSACGVGQAAMGPFYCPADQQVYIDLSFYNDLRSRHQAPGDFAQAYVIAHEVGHHVQNVLGISNQVRQLQGRASKTEANQLSVRLELQADCFAGVWANRADQARDILESGDIEEALNAASQIGDDRLQQQSRGFIVPESFTHGSSAQRVRWFKQGLATGDIEQCNTFATNQI